MKLRLIYCTVILVMLIAVIMNIKILDGSNMKITKEKAIEIANKEVEKFGYNIESMNIKITKYNTSWNEYIPKESKSEYDLEHKKKLANKEYWAVYYYPKSKGGEVIKGGEICIFVNSDDGTIIITMRWK